jgi:hypothetical protein
MMKTFWTNDHDLSPLAEKMSEQFISMIGPTDFIEAECYRAVLKLHHDYYNNGFGNEMSRPIAYLDLYFAKTASSEWREAFKLIRETAMEPWNRNELDEEFQVFVAEPLLALNAASEAGTLRPIDENDIWTMPHTAIQWPNESEEDEEDEEYIDG